MNRPASFTTPIFSLAIYSLLWLSSLAPALAATAVTDTFQLKATGKEWCRNDPKFFNTTHVKATEGLTFTVTRDVLGTGDLTDIQATINNSDNATLDAITLNGRALPVNRSGSTAQLVLSGRDPGNPDHFLTLRGKATFDKAGNLTKVTGTYVYQVLSDSGGIPNTDCFGSGTFGTGKKLPPPNGLPQWAQAKLEAYVKASNTGAAGNSGVNDNFGVNVALSGDTLAVGATGEDSCATGINGDQTNNSCESAAGVYVFTRTNGVWSQQAYVKASNTETIDFFGVSVALSGDTLAVGAHSEDSCATGINGDQTNNGCPEAGAVYVFTRTNGVWSQQAYVKASNTEAVDFFGITVALSGDTLAVGADSEASCATGINGDQTNNSCIRAGAVYVFTRTAGVWSQQAYLKASNTAAEDRFGLRAIALSGDTLAVGAVVEASCATGISGDQANNGCLRAGAVYVFTRTAGVWSQQAYVKASNTGAGDFFGQSIALSGDTLAVGAAVEASCATGINGDQTNNGCSDAGAVYVFTRTAGVWSQQAYVKASNTAANDHFFPLALSGDTLAVGATGEDSCATGINGDHTNNGCTGAGTAYVFTRTNGVWNQQAYVKASNTGAGDVFGQSIALSGDTLAVGAHDEASCATGINGDQTNNGCDNAGAAYMYVAQ